MVEDQCTVPYLVRVKVRGKRRGGIARKAGATRLDGDHPANRRVTGRFLMTSL